MINYMMQLSIITLLLHIGVVVTDRPQPNILFILADDLGWNDVSWNNAAMSTPNIELLATQGIRLEQSYSQQVNYKYLISSSINILPRYVLHLEQPC